MTTAPALDTETTRNDDDDGDTLHYFCECDPDAGLCGKDLTGLEEITDAAEELICVVCDDLAENPCKRCGA